MIQRPNAVGLVLCDDVLIEEGTRSITLVRCFDRLAAKTFPSPEKRFTVFAVLTDGIGPMSLTVTITKLDTDEEIHVRKWRVEFRDPLVQARLAMSVGPCSFPEPG